jgi:hypothetical protein
LAAIIEKFHHHQEVDEPLQALIFDSHKSVSWNRSDFPSEKRTNQKGQKIKFMATK